MTWEIVTADVWKEIVTDHADDLANDRPATMIERFQLVSPFLDQSDKGCAIH